MIPFFRKIRKQLADDGKPIKYLRYAIGEIVLVVIGILIALQINNANENRKNDEKIISIFREIQRELGHNINEATESITYYKKKDSLISLVLQKKVTKKNYLNDLNLGFLLFNRVCILFVRRKNRRFFRRSNIIIECLSPCTKSDLSINYIRCWVLVLYFCYYFP